MPTTITKPVLSEDELLGLPCTKCGGHGFRFPPPGDKDVRVTHVNSKGEVMAVLTECRCVEDPSAHCRCRGTRVYRQICDCDAGKRLQAFEKLQYEQEMKRQANKARKQAAERKQNIEKTKREKVPLPAEKIPAAAADLAAALGAELNASPQLEQLVDTAAGKS